MDPFHKIVMTRLTVISIVNPQMFLIFVFKKKNVCTFIRLFFVLPLHQMRVEGQASKVTHSSHNQTSAESHTYIVYMQRHSQ